MMFGLRNAAQTFQRFIDEVFQGLDFTFGYLDDILIFSHSEEEHMEHLKTLFRRLKKYGVLINTSKSILGVKEVDFLGYHISVQETCPMETKVVAIKEFPLPKTTRELRRFLGMLNYYCRCLKDAASTQAPLLDALCGRNIKGSKPVIMTPEMLKAFEDCKSSLSDATMLPHPNPHAELSLYTDASVKAIGAVLQQKVKNCWETLAFFSRKLTSAQKKYSPYDRELLAIYESIKYFRFMVEARHFTVYTDHKPITFAFVTKRDNFSPRQHRYLSFISQFTTEIKHVSGCDNTVADALSRIETISEILNYEDLANDQNSDPELQDLINKGTTLRLEKIKSPEATIYCDISTHTPRPYITPRFRRQVFSQMHNLSHPGASTTAKLVSERFV
ncbi:unnamed protein product [Parnassius mnemosyne]|uniref:Reverse transcriptase domain-containing protein n=1 Tax=Parnassius mnemosyne TaxID=213953 RepID=A0AAV1LYW0_9NEOP